MDDSERLLDYYERELSYLRSAGEVFARQYPKVAKRLELSGDESPDPHVERLLEGFAFLAARIHQNIDESGSDVANNLLEQLYPHALRPVPSATIVRFVPDQAKVSLDAGYEVKRGTSLFTHDQEGDTVYFRTSYPVTLWPVAVARIALEEAGSDDVGGAPADELARSVLRLTLRYPRSFAAGGARPGKLRFYVKGGSYGAPQLCDLLLGHTLEVHWRSGARARQRLGALPCYVGLEPGDALLPERADTHSAYRLLLEYFAFPAKFHFFELDCSGMDFTPAPHETGPGPDLEGELRFLLKRKAHSPFPVENDVIQLGCTPAVNLFERSAEPLRVTARQAEYPLVADHHRARATEIYSVDRVLCASAGTAASEVPAYFSSRSEALAARQGGPYWFARRVAARGADAGTGPGTKSSAMLLTFVDPDFAPAAPLAARTLSARVTCTNRHLARQLDADAAFAIEDAGPIGAIHALHKPSAQVQPSLDGAARWQLVSQLSLNQWSLAEGRDALPALRRLLSLNNLSGELVADSQIQGLSALRADRVTRFAGAADDPWHGYRQGYVVTVQLAQQAFRDGSQMLFCAVLQRFLALYGGINTFVELVLEDEGGRVLQRWQPLASRHLSL